MPIVTGQISTVIYPRQEQQVSQESQESRQFWTEQGYPQYGGRYAPVEVPEGYRISRVVETETGLRVTFTKPYEKSFPRKETKKGMVLEPLQTAEVNKIVGIGRARQPSTKIYYFEPPSKEETEAYFERQEAYRKAVESGKLKFLPRYIHYTGYGHATSPYLPPYKPGLVNPFTGKPFASVKEWQKENARQYSEYQASVKFWTEQGYPEFAGKYKVPTVPEGYTLTITKTPIEVHKGGVVSVGWVPQVSLSKPSGKLSQQWSDWTEQEAYDILTSPKISLTKQGEITYVVKEQEQPKSITETLSEITVVPITRMLGLKPIVGTKEWTQEVITGKPYEVRPFAGVASAIVAPTERLVYTVGTLAGVKTPTIPPSPLSFSEQERAKAWGYGTEYVGGEILGEILLSMGINKGLSVAGSYAKAGALKVAGILEKELAPETYYYYRYILAKPMLETMATTYSVGTAKALIGEEAFFYTTKIAYPTLVQQTLPTLATATRTYLIETYAGEAYLYGKAVLYPTLKFTVMPQLTTLLSESESYAKNVFLQSPMGEAYLYAKAVAYPNIVEANTKLFTQALSVTRETFIESPFGEVYLYTKSVAIPQYTKFLEELSTKIPTVSMPSFVSEFMVETKMLFGKEYIIPLAETPSYPMKPLYTPREIVEFPTKPLQATKQVAVVVAEETEVSPPINVVRELTEFASVSLEATTTNIMLAWTGKGYPFITPSRRTRIVEELETIHYPHQPFETQLQTPTRLSAMFEKIASSQAPLLGVKPAIAQMKMYDEKPSMTVREMILSQERLAQAEKQTQSQMQEQSQLQKQMLKQMQIQTPKVPTIGKQETEKTKKRKKQRLEQLYGFYVWEFPILDPEKVWKLK